MASDEAAYNPISYHNGTVWPHDTSLTAWGLARHGYPEAARRVARALIEAAAHFDWSLPEVFAGYARDETPFPIAYPTAARPQAWAAGTPILLVRVLLGIEPDRVRQRLVTNVTDELPSWLEGLRVEGRAGLRAQLVGFGRARACNDCGRRLMRVGMICPVWFPVPPEAYGGIERVVALLADGLVDAGHEVTMFASGDSQTRARLESVFDTAPSEWIGHTFWEMQHLVNAIRRADEFDILNDHTGLLGLAFGGLQNVPFCHTVHGPLEGRPGRLYEEVVSLAPEVKLISISMNQRKPKLGLPWIANCPNALDLSVYPFRRKSGGDYLLFLGRMSPDKGAHRALAVALETGLPLKIAAKCREPLEIRYFDEFVRPHLGEVDRVRGRGRARRQGRAPAREPARSCIRSTGRSRSASSPSRRWLAGRPSSPHGEAPSPRSSTTGGRGSSSTTTARWRTRAVLEQADSLDPAEIRREVEDRFSPEHMVADYVAAYEATIAATTRRVKLRSPYDREIGKLAVPALGALAAEPLYLLVDTAIVGHLGRSQLAALGIAATILGGSFAIFNFLQYGTTAQVARAGGAGESEIARRLGAQALWLSLAFGIAVSALIAILAEPLVASWAERGRPRSTQSPTSASPRSASLLPFSRSAGRGTCAGSPTCGRRS